MASRDSDFELSADSLSIHDDTGHVTAATEPHSSRHNTHANFMVALQQGSNAPVTKGIEASLRNLDVSHTYTNRCSVPTRRPTFPQHGHGLCGAFY